ncbi:MAG: hypothetical protein Q9215_007619 [Flavoplaca cf. flavocitrina]
MVAIKCQYERKFRKPQEAATEKDLQQFNFTNQTIPSASAVSAPTTGATNPPTRPKAIEESLVKQTQKDLSSRTTKSRSSDKEVTPTTAPPSAMTPKGAEVALTVSFDGSFRQREHVINARLSASGAAARAALS